MEIVAFLIYVIIFLALAGYFSGYETGVISIPLSEVEVQKEKRKKSIYWLIERLKNPEKLVSVTLVATNFFLTSAVLIFLFAITKLIPRESIAEVITVLSITPLSIIFSEILPKSIFRTKPILIFKTVKIFQIIYYLIYPLAYIFYFLPSKFINLLAKVPVRSKVIKSKEEIKTAITRGEEKGILEEHETTILYKIFDLGEKQVKEIMLPMKKIIRLEKGLSLTYTFQEFKKYNFSRLPIYDSQKGEFVGWVNYMDFLISDFDPRVRIEEIMHALVYVDDNIYLDDLLVIMLKNRAHLVGIKNSLGITVGIVTLEDVLEEIVGEY